MSDLLPTGRLLSGQTVGNWGGKKVSLFAEEEVQRQAIAGYRVTSWFYAVGPLAFTNERVIWAPGKRHRLFTHERIILLSEIREVGIHKKTVDELLFGSPDQWFIRTDREEHVFGFGSFSAWGSDPEDPAEWIEDIRQWAKIPS